MNTVETQTVAVRARAAKVKELKAKGYTCKHYSERGMKWTACDKGNERVILNLLEPKRKKRNESD